MPERTYIAIDLKSFYASVECIERGLDPMTANLVVADKSRTEKTICLAVSPSLKVYGIPGRARLFEVVQKIREVNEKRRQAVLGHKFTGSSFLEAELRKNPSLKVDYITAPPQMAKYMKISGEIYQIYLKYIAPEDIHVYSIDEVFMDVTDYLGVYKTDAKNLAKKIIQDVFHTMGITATAGIGTNLYLCKTAMDIVAKHIPADECGVRIAQLDEMSYRRQLWSHRPLTDFWRVGRGYAKKLEAHGLYTMGDIARCSLGKSGDYYSEDLLYRLFGVNAELLIDHAWGWEPCTIRDIKRYKPQNNSVGSGQVLKSPYSYDRARLAAREMADMVALDLLDKGLVTDQIVLTVGYDIENLRDPQRRRQYGGEVTVDRYGRNIPRHAHGTIHLEGYTSSARQIIRGVTELFEKIVDENLLVRRIYMSAEHVIPENRAEKEEYQQMELFTHYTAAEKEQEKEKTARERDRKVQKAMLEIKKKYGKNAVLRGMNLEEGATARDRNGQIGGHRA